MRPPDQDLIDIDLNITVNRQNNKFVILCHGHFMEKPINLDLENDLMDQEVGKHFFRQMAGTEAAEQIIKMRKKRFMRQVDLAKATGMTQSAISRIEQADYASWGFQTYLTVAEGLQAIVHISLEPIEDFLERHKAQVSN